MLRGEADGVIGRNLSKWTPAQILISTFALLILVGSVLLSLPVAFHGPPLSYVDALFTATSAVCVTGLAVVDTATQFTWFGQLVILILIQLGGLGLMTMATVMALFLGRKISFRNRLIMQESLNQFSLGGILRLTIAVGVVTGFFEALGAIILTARFLPRFGWATALWYGIFHSVSAFCNAGFDLIGRFQSFTPFASDWLINLVITTLVIFGGLGFSVVADVYNHRQNLSRLSLHTKLVLSMSFFLIVTGTLSLLLVDWNGSLAELPVANKVLGAYFQSVTTRTAGFCTVPIGNFSSAGILLMILFMFIGASPGSTGGGVKTTTVATVVLGVLSTIKGREDAQAFDRRIPQEIVRRATAIVSIAFALVLSVTILLSLTEEQPFMSVLFESVSAFATVGLSLGVTPQLSFLGRLIIMLTMFVGRVGPMSLALALVRSEGYTGVRYPEEKIIVG